MSFDLETFLVLGVAVTGTVWLVDLFWLAPARRQAVMTASHPSNRGDAQLVDAQALATEPWFTEYSKSFFPVLLIVLILRSFIAEPFRIPSGSMLPTLQIGDFILVNKFSYGIRLPIVNAKVIEVGEPKRGDVAVFRYPGNPSDDYIKRVVGLPGDQIAYYNKMLYINGEPMAQTEMGVYTETVASPRGGTAVLHTEQLGEIEHQILIMSDRLSFRGEGQWVVPPEHYFVLGDNRDNSNDSRFWKFVPEENLVGKAFFIWLNADFQSWSMDFSRIGSSIE